MVNQRKPSQPGVRYFQICCVSMVVDQLPQVLIINGVKIDCSDAV